ncbi:MAG TPA: MurR/RpiR family transcriptional regulator [Anaerolineaceae bacterium]|jgi:DNA-binding MurR/RpiR family transcriptional regulator|nr:MurR/RpiR family transcriptional regulator [Anaerolineaceae bacterium]
MNSPSKSPPKIDFSQVLTDHFNNLTKSEKRIANFLRKNQEESAFLSAGEIASRLDLSEATLVRFARSLGFSSYPTMRAVLQDNFRRRVTHSARLRGRLNDLRDGGDIFERLTATEIDFLSQALDSIKREELNNAVEILHEHDRVFVFGLGPSVSLVDLLELRLRRFGREVVPLTSSGREFLEYLTMMEEKDLLFVICFFDQNPALKLVIDYANKVGATIIMLTDTLEAILGDKVDVVLSAKRGPIGEFHSLVVPMTVINALLLSLASMEQEKSMTLLDKLDNLRDQLKAFNTCADE